MEMGGWALDNVILFIYLEKMPFKKKKVANLKNSD